MALAPIVSRAQARQVLTRTGGFLAGFSLTFNPAVGCLFGRGLCGQFCYARESFAHRCHGRGDWGEYLTIKENAPELLARELTAAARRPATHPEPLARMRVYPAPTTDPCLGPLVDLYGRCLRAVAAHRPARWVLQTRSPLVVRLRSEIEALADCLVLSLTLETDDVPDFAPLLGRCRFNDCRDLAEPGCAIRASITAGAIDADRHAFYAELLAEMDALRRRDPTLP